MLGKSGPLVVRISDFLAGELSSWWAKMHQSRAVFELRSSMSRGGSCEAWQPHVRVHGGGSGLDVASQCCDGSLVAGCAHRARRGKWDATFTMLSVSLRLPRVLGSGSGRLSTKGYIWKE